MYLEINILIVLLVLAEVSTSSTSNEVFLEEMRKSYRLVVARMPADLRNDLNQFREILTEQEGVNLEDPSYSLKDVAKSMSFPKAIIKYLQRKLGIHYPTEIMRKENRSKFVLDYRSLLLIPCKSLVDIYSYSISLFLLKKYQPGLVETVKTDREMYNALIAGQVCFYLIELTDLLTDKSFRYMIAQKLKPKNRLFGFGSKKVEVVE